MVRGSLLQSLEHKKEILIREITKEVPGFEILSKRNHPLWKFLSKVMFWNPRIATGFITTLYPKVWVPSLPWKEDDPASAIEILAHEYVHLQDRKRLGYFFNLLYLSPQILSLFALLSFVNPWCLLFLVCLLPLPSPGRAWLEYRGYRMSMAITYWIHDECLDLDWVVSQFTGPNYYWMYPFRGHLKRQYEREFERIKQNTLTSDLKHVKSILEL
jgi:hypothetical protein